MFRLKKPIKITLIILSSLIGIALVTYGALYILLPQRAWLERVWLIQRSFSMKTMALR